jgi:hypothetical protein
MFTIIIQPYKNIPLNIFLSKNTMKESQMSGLRTSVLKASALAVIAAILLGAAIHILSLQIELEPTVATVDAYTEKGGYGPGIVSSSYLNNENVSIFAYLKDLTDKPVAGATVTFEIHGPLGSNIKLTQTATTNSSGVAVATVTPSHQADQQENVLGVWTATATTDIAGTQIVDSLAFEIKTPPSPFIDVYTDRGGNGSNTPSQPYSLDETVNLYAKLSNGTSPVEGIQVAFYIYDPENSIVLVPTPESNSSGIAEATFRIPNVPEAIGPWRVMVTARVYDERLVDALTFECNSNTP